MSEMTTQEMIGCLEKGGLFIVSIHRHEADAIAARLKALEEMRCDLERYCALAEKQIRAPLVETKGFGSLPEVVRGLRAILDTVREGP